MIVYRIARTRYADDLTGIGAKLHGGRWNLAGTPCLYTAGSRALAILEYSANVALDDMPRALSIVTLEVPGLAVTTPAMRSFPGDWMLSPPPDSVQRFGNALLAASKTLVIRVPSVVIPEEHNYLLNPLHADMAKVKIIGVSDFSYDVRVKK